MVQKLFLQSTAVVACKAAGLTIDPWVLRAATHDGPNHLGSWHCGA